MRTMVAAFDTGDTSSLEEFAHPDYLDHRGLSGESPISGIDGFRRVIETARGGYTNLSVTIADLMDGTRPGCRKTRLGRHSRVSRSRRA
jgi:hypothetical protein